MVRGGGESDFLSETHGHSYVPTHSTKTVDGWGTLSRENAAAYKI